MKKTIIISALIAFLVGIAFTVVFFPMLFGFGPMGTGMMGGMGGAEIDRHFIEQMIPHHDDAIMMAEMALTRAEHPELKQLAENIKRTQSEENAKMRQWYKSWYGADVPKESSMGAGMMGQGGMGDGGDMSRLETAKPFDKAFIEQMIPHHRMAIMMTGMLLRGTQREEMRKLGEDIIKAQSSEISQMRAWYGDWYLK
jgi:uncharacterized protein (DUF305 family)